jgi:hypothetical protein
MKYIGFFFIDFGPFNVAFTQNESFWINLLTILFKFESNFNKKHCLFLFII